MSLEAQQPPAAAAIGALIAMLGPLAGQHATIVLAALAGAMWPLAARPTATKRAAALFVMRLVATAAVLGGVIAWALETHLGIPGQFTPTLAAWAIGAVGDAWPAVIRAGLRRLGIGSDSGEEQ
jgi:hypothetical protein